MARTMNPFMASPALVAWTPDSVQHAADPGLAFCEYIQQHLGVPMPTIRDLATLRKKAKDFFQLYPHTDWRTLCRVVGYMQARKRRVPRVWMVVDEFRKAWAAGALPELDPANRVEPGVEERISAALAVETDDRWRRRLLLAQGGAAQQEVYVAWRTARAS